MSNNDGDNDRIPTDVCVHRARVELSESKKTTRDVLR